MPFGNREHSRVIAMIALVPPRAVSAASLSISGNTTPHIPRYLKVFSWGRTDARFGGGHELELVGGFSDVPPESVHHHSRRGHREFARGPRVQQV